MSTDNTSSTLQELGSLQTVHLMFINIFKKYNVHSE